MSQQAVDDRNIVNERGQESPAERTSSGGVWNLPRRLTKLRRGRSAQRLAQA